MQYTHEGFGAPIQGVLTGDVTSVIVVGAGAAGLTVANALSGEGVPTLVLEARDRLGGRLHTAELGSAAVDLGASWIHQPIGNPLSDICRSFGIDQVPLEAYDEMSAWDPDTGKILAPAAFNTLSEHAERVLEEALTSSQPMLLDAIDETAEAQGLQQPTAGRVRALARMFAEADSCGPLEDLATDGFPANTQELEGSPLGDVPVGGYRELVQVLSAGLDVHLGTPVRSISVDADGVLVVTDEATEHRASHAVVTVPLGVLKSRGIEFSPPLHPERLSAIDRLGFGRFDKLVLLYDRPYWRDADVRHLALTPSASAAPVHALLGMDEVAGEPIIMFFAFGSTHAWLGARDLDEVAADAHQLLCEALGRELPPPIDCLRSTWWTDEWTQGAYAYLKSGSSYEDLEMLGLPHAGRVLFAGEATGAARTGYVDGAILTGVREAKRLLAQDAVTLARR